MGCLFTTIARRFYEPGYTIYSPLEYFIMLIIVVPCMAFNISIFKSNEQFSSALKSLLGDGSNYLWLFIIWYTYDIYNYRYCCFKFSC